MFFCCWAGTGASDTLTTAGSEGCCVVQGEQMCARCNATKQQKKKTHFLVKTHLSEKCWVFGRHLEEHYKLALKYVATWSISVFIKSRIWWILLKKLQHCETTEMDLYTQVTIKSVPHASQVNLQIKCIIASANIHPMTVVLVSVQK